VRNGRRKLAAVAPEGPGPTRCRDRSGTADIQEPSELHHSRSGGTGSDAKRGLENEGQTQQLHEKAADGGLSPFVAHDMNRAR
jgi:hypothetical protein